MRETGRGLAEGKMVPSADGRARLEAAVKVLNQLGGLAELEGREGAFVIRSRSCPLAAVTPDHPEVCRMAETLLAELAGVPIHEHCDRGDSPRCYFEVEYSGNAAPE